MTTPPVKATQPIPQPTSSINISPFSDIQKIINGKVLIVAMHKEDRRPFFFIDKAGKLAGIDVEIAEILASTLGVKVEYIRTASTFDEVISQVSSGQAHVGISKLSYTPERSKKVIYLRNYIDLHVSFIISRILMEKFPSNASLRDILSKNNQLKLCVIGGTSYVDIAANVLPDATVVLNKDWDEVKQSLNTGKCFATIRDDCEFKKFLLNEPRLNLMYNLAVLKTTDDPICAVVRPDMPTLAQFFDLLFQHNKKLQFSLDEIFKKYRDELK